MRALFSFLLALALVSPSAQAKSTPKSPSGAIDPSASTPPSAPAPRSLSTPAEAQAFERALERRWTRTREVYVVAERLYPKAHRFEMGFFVGTLPNDPFLVYLAGGARLAWHFNEQIALEVSGAYTHGFDTGLRTSLHDQDALVTAQIRDRVLGRMDLALLWSPIYGKFALSNRRVGHFDLYFLLAASGLWAEKNDALSLNGGPWGGGGLGVGFRFFLTRLISLRVEFRQRVEVREGVGDSSLRVAYPSEINLGLSFLLGRGSSGARP